MNTPPKHYRAEELLPLNMSYGVPLLVFRIIGVGIVAFLVWSRGCLPLTLNQYLTILRAISSLPVLDVLVVLADSVISWYIVQYFLLVVLHEYIHVIVSRLVGNHPRVRFFGSISPFIREKGRWVFNPGLEGEVRFFSEKVTKGQMMISAIVPLVLLNTVGALLLLYSSDQWFVVGAVILYLNTSGSVVDFFVWLWLFGLPDGTYMHYNMFGGSICLVPTDE